MSENTDTEEKAPEEPTPAPPSQARPMSPIYWLLVVILVGVLVFQVYLIAKHRHGTESTAPESAPIGGVAPGPAPGPGPAGGPTAGGEMGVLMASPDRLSRALVQMDAQSATTIKKSQAGKLLVLMGKLNDDWGRELTAGAQFYNEVQKTLTKSQFETVMKFRQGLPQMAPPGGVQGQQPPMPAGGAQGQPPMPASGAPGQPPMPAGGAQGQPPMPASGAPGQPPMPPGGAQHQPGFPPGAGQPMPASPGVPGPAASPSGHTFRFDPGWALTQMPAPSSGAGASTPAGGTGASSPPPPMTAPGPGGAAPPSGGGIDDLVAKLGRIAGETPEAVSPATGSGQPAAGVAPEDVIGVTAQLGQLSDLTKAEAHALLAYARSYQMAHDETVKVKQALLEVLTPAQRSFLNQQVVARQQQAPIAGEIGSSAILNILAAKAK